VTAARLLAVAGVVFALDRATKWLVVDALALRERLALDIVPGLLQLRMAWNRGINFGLFAGDGATQPALLAGLAIAVSAAVAVWTLRAGDGWRIAGGGLLIGGALGNAWDRLVYPERAVADFLNVTCCGLVNPYAFNVADVAIFAGAAVLVLAPEPGPRRAGGAA
jgi:signal peptidase II